MCQTFSVVAGVRMQNSWRDLEYCVRTGEPAFRKHGITDHFGDRDPWVELYNGGSNTVSLANWSLTDSGNARKFVIPNGTNLPAGGYLVIWCDSQTNSPGLHAGFNLARKGESLFLYDALTNRIDAFSFGLQLTNYTVGRIGPSATWQLTTPTPGSSNVAAAVGSATSRRAACCPCQASGCTFRRIRPTRFLSGTTTRRSTTTRRLRPR